jgi:hypothetical protein
MRVLVVEDNELVREVAVAALRDAGFHVSEAASGEKLVAEPTPPKKPEKDEQGTAADPDGGHLHLEPDDPVRVLVVEKFGSPSWKACAKPVFTSAKPPMARRRLGIGTAPSTSFSPILICRAAWMDGASPSTGGRGIRQSG